jgi:hypothetical protein
MCCEGLGTLLVVIALVAQKGKERVEERGKRGKETQRGALATRNPLSMNVTPGEVMRR